MRPSASCSQIWVCEVEVASAADGLVDATYVRDPGLVTGAGAVLFQMAKPARVAEPALLGGALTAAGVRLVGRLDGGARADGGDFIWCNVLAIEPRRVVMLKDNPRTQAALEAAGCEVHGFDGSEISVKGDGGPTCLTAPIWRGGRS